MDGAQPGFGGKSKLRRLDFDLAGVRVIIRLAEIFMVVEGKMVSVQNDVGPFNPFQEVGGWLVSLAHPEGAIVPGGNFFPEKGLPVAFIDFGSDHHTKSKGRSLSF